MRIGEWFKEEEKRIWGGKEDDGEKDKKKRERVKAIYELLKI